MAGRRSTQLPEYAGPGPAVIEPSKVRPSGVRLPRRAVVCWLGEVMGKLEARRDVRVLHRFRSEMGPLPVLQVGTGRQAVALYLPGIGGPMAAAGMEQLIALGVRSLIGCGGAGVVVSALQPGAVVVPTQALRDEGTSFHYQRRSRYNRPHPDAVRAIRQACQQRGTPFVTGKTWTTDAPYRETREKVAARRAEGCLTVEMEAASLFAVAHLRKVRYGQLLYGGDDVGGEVWDRRRGWDRATGRERLVMLAIDAVRILDRMRAD